MKNIILSFAVIACAASAYAKCELVTERTACPGVDQKAMLKPYNGVNPTTKAVDVADEAACKAKAEKDVEIVRKKELAHKSTIAKWDGKEIAKLESKSECK